MGSDPSDAVRDDAVRNDVDRNDAGRNDGGKNDGDQNENRALAPEEASVELAQILRRIADRLDSVLEERDDSGDASEPEADEHVAFDVGPDGLVTVTSDRRVGVSDEADAGDTTDVSGVTDTADDSTESRSYVDARLAEARTRLAKRQAEIGRNHEDHAPSTWSRGQSWLRTSDVRRAIPYLVAGALIVAVSVAIGLLVS